MDTLGQKGGLVKATDTKELRDYFPIYTLLINSAKPSIVNYTAVKRARRMVTGNEGVQVVSGRMSPRWPC